jgi:hypothetical protein
LDFLVSFLAACGENEIYAEVPQALMQIGHGRPHSPQTASRKAHPTTHHPPSPLRTGDENFQKPILESIPDRSKGRCLLHTFLNYGIDHMSDVKLITVREKWAKSERKHSDTTSIGLEALLMNIKNNMYE